MALGAGMALRFFLELAALAAAVHWGFSTHAAWPQKLLFGIVVPAAGAALWGIFRVPDDPGPAPVAVPGLLRLLLELALFAGAFLALRASGSAALALVFAGLLVLDYALTYRRVARLLGSG